MKIKFIYDKNSLTAYFIISISEAEIIFKNGLT